MFVDEVLIRVQAGHGGNGLSSFRREKYVAKGGPDGGDGGDGGDIIAQADNDTDTLSSYRHQSVIRAEHGQPGKKQRAHGKSGEDRVIKVPAGTMIYQDEVLIADLDEPGVSMVIARGGRGGYGNAHFKSSRRQAPRMAELGESGEDKELRLELKTIADVGLVGMPNAGKSTLLSVISNAKPSIADYPFTTVTPNLGVADIFEDSLVVADIPGLIEGASEGKGLGDAFLRHIERTHVLLHLIDSSCDDVVVAYQTIRRELDNYRIDLSDKPEVVVLTKTDAVDTATLVQHRQALETEAGIDQYRLFDISSVAHEGLRDMLAVVHQLVAEARKRTPATGEQVGELPVITLADDPEAWWVEQRDGRYVIFGKDINRFAERTDFNDDEAMRRLRDILHKRGIDRELKRRDIHPGDVVETGGKTFEW